MSNKFAIVGKGGVGKSTISTVLSRLLKIPCIMVDQQRNVLDFDPNANIMEFRFEYCMKLLDDFLHSNGLLASLEEMSKVISHEFGIMLASCDAMARAANGFVLDMPPNTVALQLLRYPKLFDAKVTKVLLLKNRIRELTGVEDAGMKAVRTMQSIFEEGRKNLDEVKFMPLTTPEPVAVLETERLIRFMNEQHFMIGGIIVNRLRSTIGNCRYCKSVNEKQKKTLERIIEIAKGYRLIVIPELMDPIKEIEDILRKELL